MIEVRFHDLAHVGRVIQCIHFFHPFREKSARLLGQLNKELIEGFFHNLKVMGASCDDTSIDMQQAPGSQFFAVVAVHFKILRAVVDDVGNQIGQRQQCLLFLH